MPYGSGLRWPWQVLPAACPRTACPLGPRAMCHDRRPVVPLAARRAGLRPGQVQLVISRASALGALLRRRDLRWTVVVVVVLAIAGVVALCPRPLIAATPPPAPRPRHRRSSAPARGRARPRTTRPWSAGGSRPHSIPARLHARVARLRPTRWPGSACPVWVPRAGSTWPPRWRDVRRVLVGILVSAVPRGDDGAGRVRRPFRRFR